MAPIQFLVNLLSFSLASFVIYWSKTGNLKDQIRYLFEHKKLDTPELQADHLADITFYYSLFVLCLSILVTLVRFFKGEFNQALTPDSKFVTSLNKVIANSLEHLIIFACIYVYLLQKNGAGLNTNTLLLMPSWFLLGRAGSFVEQILTGLTKNRLIFSFFGFTLTFFPYIAMIGQIFGYSPLKWF